MKISFVTTVLNEEETIRRFLDSIIRQTKKTDEVIVVDGGSTDKTLSVISNYRKQHSIVILGTSSVLQNEDSRISKNERDPGQARMTLRDCKIKVLRKKGNRAVGRNYGIKRAKNEIILLSDAGCTLDKNWVKRIIQPFTDKTVDVVAGYYAATPKTLFEKCLIPYVFVMPDKVNPKTFLPASRSMAFRKEIWKKVGGFPQEFSHNEDYVFANRLKKMNATIVFKEDAIVYWQPRTNLKQAFIMFFRFALGDAEAKIYRPKVILTILRYLFAILLAAIIFMLQSIQAVYLLGGLTLLYIFWSIIKNFRYVNDSRAFIILLLLQITSDVAVASGMTVGLLRSLRVTPKNP